MRAQALALIRLLAAVLILTAVVLALRLWTPASAEYSAEYRVFGSTAQVQLRSHDDARAKAALTEIGALLEQSHRDWHAWESDSALGQLNAALAAGRPAVASADLRAMIRHAQDGYRLSGGIFNAAMGKLIDAWGFHTSEYPVQAGAPDPAELRNLQAHKATMEDIELAPDGTVRSRNTELALDLNGLAEGYAAQQVAELLAARGIDNALVVIGGDAHARGDAGGRPWQVGLRNPAGGLLGHVFLHHGEALSSSGDYIRYRLTDEGRAGHIVDPREAAPQRRTTAVSVLSDDPVLADMAATALTVAGARDFVTTARRMGIGCALLLDRGGEIFVTPAMRARLQGFAADLPWQQTASTGRDCRRPRP